MPTDLDRRREAVAYAAGYHAYCRTDGAVVIAANDAQLNCADISRLAEMHDSTERQIRSDLHLLQDGNDAMSLLFDAGYRHANADAAAQAAAEAVDENGV